VISDDDQQDAEAKARAKAQILSLAKQLLAGQLSVIAASQELSPLGIRSKLNLQKCS